MFIQFREESDSNSSHRWYKRLDGRRLPTWAMVTLLRFVRRYRSGDGLYSVEPNGLVMKVADNDNGAYNRRYDNLRSLDRFGYTNRKDVNYHGRQNHRRNYSNW